MIFFLPEYEAVIEIINRFFKKYRQYQKLIKLIKMFCIESWYLYSMIPLKVNNSSSTEMFRNEINKWKPNDCDCKLCQDYLYRIRFGLNIEFGWSYPFVASVFIPVIIDLKDPRYLQMWWDSWIRLWKFLLINLFIHSIVVFYLINLFLGHYLLCT